MIFKKFITFFYFTNQKNEKIWEASVVTVCVNMDTLESEIIPENLKKGLASCSHD